jgi:tetratricopeptide (TPR) repeat protein
LLENGKKSVSLTRYRITLAAMPSRGHSVCTMKLQVFTLPVFAAVIGLSCGIVDGQAIEKWSELNSDGIRFFAYGQYAAAEVKFRAALLEAGQFPEGDFRVSATLSNIALTRQEQGDLAEAERLYRRVLELREQYFAPGTIEIASTLNNLANVLHDLGRNREADPLLRRALLIAEDAHNEKVIASVLNTLGMTLAGEGERARAEPVMRRALALFQQAGGADCLDAGKAANNLAALYTDQGEFVKAEEMERIALPIYKNHLPEGHPLIGAVMNNMFAILESQKRHDEAEPYLIAALEISEKSDAHSLRAQRMRTNLAVLRASHGDWQGAADIFKKVIAEEEKILGPDHPTVALTLTGYSEALKHLNQKTEAKEAERRANAILKSFRP